MIENVRLSEKARTQLITMKRRTGLVHWNTLCRWAFCVSLAEKSIPPPEEIPADSNVEMSWRVFTGGVDDVYWGLLLQRAQQDAIPLDRESLTRYFRLHLHRGISYLVGNPNMQSIEDLMMLVV